MNPFPPPSSNFSVYNPSRANMPVSLSFDLPGEMVDNSSSIVKSTIMNQELNITESATNQDQNELTKSSLGEKKSEDISNIQAQSTNNIKEPKDAKTERKSLMEIVNIGAKIVGGVFIVVTLPAVAIKKFILAALENAFKPSMAQNITAEKLSEKLKIIIEVKDKAEKDHKFEGYSLSDKDGQLGVLNLETKKRDLSKAASSPPDLAKMELKIGVRAKGIGTIANCYTWSKPPAKSGIVPEEIQNPAVRLPKGMTADNFNSMRSLVQNGALSNGIDGGQSREIALNLGGITIEATLPYKAGILLKDEGDDVNIHCIFQTGLNFGGNAGGGIPVTGRVDEKQIQEFTKKNSFAAISSASQNGSDVLVFNIGIGVGFFAGDKGDIVKQGNVDGLCEAVKANRKAKIGKNESQMEVIVPNVGFNPKQLKQLESVGIKVIAADKGAVAALCAREGLKVSETFAGDPMTMLGIHGPGFWWETAGSASDEERAAYLTPSYALGHIPINVHEAGKPTPTKIAALSEFMVKSNDPEENLRDTIATPLVEENAEMFSVTNTNITNYIKLYEETERELAALDEDDPLYVSVESDLTGMARTIPNALEQNKEILKAALSTNPELKIKFEAMQGRISEHLRKIDNLT
ncbi:MAG: hypothetical protein H0T62_05565 [Parachlamydiaceae bacterium]|nr:hypothetical protein [Parachlamydiaceae bacterium]